MSSSFFYLTELYAVLLTYVSNVTAASISLSGHIKEHFYLFMKRIRVLHPVETFSKLSPGFAFFSSLTYSRPLRIHVQYFGLVGHILRRCK